MMMPYYTGTVFPKPQQAEYRNECLPLQRSGVIVGKDVENPDALVKVLVERVERYGGNARVVAPEEAKACDTLVSLGSTDWASRMAELPALPKREQSYILHAGTVDGKATVVLKANDRLGLLWAIGSFNQLVHRREGRCVVRAASVSDYPYAVNRGYLHGNVNTFLAFSVAQSVLYNVHFKINKPIYKHLCVNYKSEPSEWRHPDKWPEYHQTYMRQLGAQMTPLSIKWYGGFHPARGERQEKLSGSDEDIGLLLHYARAVAAAGGHFYLQLDDMRFPLHPYDKDRFGTAREADLYILNTLLEKLHADYPRTHLMVCPPFYWGPKGGVPDWYGEPGEPYLAAMGEHLTPEIELQWTGPSVKSVQVSAEDLKWITRLIRRKPCYWQNGCITPHVHAGHYVTDPIGIWKEWYCEGFADEIDMYAFNGAFPDHCALNALVAAYFWNPKGYDPQDAVREVAGKLCGPESWEALDALNKQLAYFDRFYNWYSRRVPELDRKAAKQFSDLERRLAEIDASLKRAQEHYPAAVKAWTGMEWAIGLQKWFLNQIRGDANLVFFRAAGRQAEQAKKEADYSAETEVFLAACDFGGGHLSSARTGEAELGEDLAKASDEAPEPGEGTADAGDEATETRKTAAPAGGGADRKDQASEGTRVVVSVSGSMPSIRAEFVPPPLSSTECLLILVGRAAKTGGTRRIKVSVNDQTVFEGKNPFPRDDWSLRTFPFASKLLKDSNTLAIQDLESMSVDATPSLQLSYGIVRRAPGKTE
jgi:hypothetical protein